MQQELCISENIYVIVLVLLCNLTVSCLLWVNCFLCFAIEKPLAAVAEVAFADTWYMYICIACIGDKCLNFNLLPWQLITYSRRRRRSKKKKHHLGKQHINLVAEIYVLNFKEFPLILFFHWFPITVNYYLICYGLYSVSN